MRRSPDPTSTDGQKHLHLAVALLRADAISEAILEAHRAADFPRDDLAISKSILAELLTMKAGPTGQWFTFIQLYFAAIQVLIETLERTGIVTSEIAALLSNTEMRRLLLDFRDNLLHGGALSRPESKRFYQNLFAVNDWAHELRVTTAMHMVKVFNTEENRTSLESWLLATPAIRAPES